MTPEEGTQYLMFRKMSNGQIKKQDYLKPKSEQHAKDMWRLRMECVPVINGTTQLFSNSLQGS